MAVCAKAVQQTKNGPYIFQLDPTVTNLSQCAYVLNTGGDFVSGSIWELTPAQGLQVGAAITAVWALAWGFRQIGRVIRETQNEPNEG